MTWSEITVIVAAALLVQLWWVWVAASRLDRLHRKVATSCAALDNQLVRRASAAAELASSGLLDPVSAVLVGEAAWTALSAGSHGRPDLAVDAPDLGATLDACSLDGSTAEEQPDRERAESDLSRTVRAALGGADEVRALRSAPLGAELVDALAAAWYRVQLARRFHNEAVAQTQRVRRKILVRMLRLHGRARMPRTVEIDDAWPEAFARPGETA